jgi:hypothetical protein
MVWAIMFVALMILGRYGVDGLRDAGTVGALIVAGFGIHSFLNTFWKAKDKGNQEPGKNYWDGPGFRLTRSKRGFSLSSNARRTLSPTDGSVISTQHYAEDDRPFSSTAW